MAQACSRLAEGLHGHERQLYYFLGNSFSLRGWFEQASQWLHWYDTYRLKEVMLKAAVAENIEFVKCAATSFEAHTSLANSYVLLANTYDINQLRSDLLKRLPKEERQALKGKFTATVERAIEEFKILNDYNPNDPWIHQQLAYSYHDLALPLAEIAEYEIILKLKPNDADTLHKLGSLYFQLGRNARGLQVYDQLKKLQPSKAASLMRHYGVDAETR